jgi:hypothetical protein
VNLYGKNLIAALGIALASASVASAYVLDEDGNGHPLYWKDASMPIRYLLANDNVPGGADGEAAVHRAFESWNGVSANVQYRFDGYVDKGVQKYDGRNIVYWVYSGWSYDASLAALTFRYYDTTDGHLLDADIVFNGERYSWSVGGASYDIQNSATHEVGHFGGLGHSSDPDATMYARTIASETKKRSLSSDDVAGLDALYGGAEEGTASNTKEGVVTSSADGVSGGGSGGGCAIGSANRTGNPAELLGMGLLLASLLVRRYWLRRPVRVTRCAG